MRTRPTALLLDLDGVLRHFDPAREHEVEQRYGLPDGRLTALAFEPGRLRAAVLGRASHDEWMATVAAELGAIGPTVVADWQRYRGEVVPEVLDALREVRAAGVPVALATNATDKLGADLALLGLESEVDSVVNSSVLGHAKPSAEFFAAACAALGVPARRCLMVDDSDRVVRGARAAGLAAIRYTGPADLRYVRASLAVPAER